MYNKRSAAGTGTSDTKVGRTKNKCVWGDGEGGKGGEGRGRSNSSLSLISHIILSHHNEFVHDG